MAAFGWVLLDDGGAPPLGPLAAEQVPPAAAQQAAAVEPAAPEFGTPITFVRAPVAVDAVKNETVVARAPTATSPAATQASAAIVRPTVPVAANAAEASQGAPRVAAPAQAVASPSPDRGRETAAFMDPNAPGVTQLSPDKGTTAQAAPTPPPEPVLLRMHTIKPGETLTSIGRLYGVSVQALLANNLLIQNGDQLKIGLQLTVPGAEGVLHFVNYGESVSELAAKYGITTAAIVGFKPNEIENADSVVVGKLILIPGVNQRPRPPAPPQPEPTPAPRQAPPLTPQPVPQPAPQATPSAPPLTPAPAPARPNTAPAPPPPPPAPAPTAAPRASGSGFIWPITGPLSSYFGPSHPLGIDIDLYGRAGAPIVAARGGTVSFAGGNPCCSYGYYVDIDHGDGYKTRYAHFQAPPPVRIGQRVEQGQVVGYAGTTGYSTGVHLHFEIMRSGVPQNPLGLLP